MVQPEENEFHTKFAWSDMPLPRSVDTSLNLSEEKQQSEPEVAPLFTPVEHLKLSYLKRLRWFLLRRKWERWGWNNLPEVASSDAPLPSKVRKDI